MDYRVKPGNDEGEVTVMTRVGVTVMTQGERNDEDGKEVSSFSPALMRHLSGSF